MATAIGAVLMTGLAAFSWSLFRRGWGAATMRLLTVLLLLVAGALLVSFAGTAGLAALAVAAAFTAAFLLSGYRRG